MTYRNGKELAQEVIDKKVEFRKICEALDEESASWSTEGRWSPKQIISHLCGPEGFGYLPSLEAFLEKDIPQIGIETANPYWTGKRSRMSLDDLLAEFNREYSRIAAYIEGLSEEQLSTRAHIPMLRDSSFREFPTLAQWVLWLAHNHIGFHINQMREILENLDIKFKKVG
jgi:hypothetical protein